MDNFAFRTNPDYEPKWIENKESTDLKKKCGRIEDDNERVENIKENIKENKIKTIVFVHKVIE